MKKYLKLIGACVVTAVVAATPYLTSRAQNGSDFDLDAFIEQELQKLAAELPSDQRRQIDAYRKYIYDSIQSVVPVDDLRRQLETARELFGSRQEEPTAQTPYSTTDPSLVIGADPPSPTPKTEVTVTANFNMSGLGFPDLEKQSTAAYTWYLDGALKLAHSGVGRNSLTFTAGLLGTIHAIRLEVELAGGKKVSAALLVPVVDVDIVWFTDAYTPPGYRGKALANTQSPIAVAAQAFVPQSFGLLNYVWTVDDDTPLNAFGVGKNVILIGFPSDIHTVSVNITDFAGNINITKTIEIERAQTEVLFHKIRTGKYDREYGARKTFELAPAETFSVAALPYFFNVRVLDGLRFTWSFDKNALPEAPRNPDVFTLNIAQSRLREGRRIQKNLQLSLQNKNPKYDEVAEFTVPVVIR